MRSSRLLLNFTINFPDAEDLVVFLPDGRQAGKHMLLLCKKYTTLCI